MERLYSTFYEDIYRYVLSIVQCDEVAQDITHDTFIRAYENPHILEQENREKTKSWLLTVARNLCIDHGRKIQNENTKLMCIRTNVGSLKYATSTEDELSQYVQSKELGSVINKTLELLKEDYRQAIILYDLKQMSYKESAASLGISVAKFTSVLQRARKVFFNEIIKVVIPNIKNEVLTDRELKRIFSWFYILDIPINLEREVARKSRNFFDGINKKFDYLRSETYPEDLHDYLLSSVPLNKKDIVVDMGCGSGSLSLKLSPLVEKVYAVDHSTEMLNILKEKIKNNQLENIQPVFSDFSFTDINLNEVFNAAFCVMVLHHLYNPKEALRQLAETIAPGGHLVIADFIYTNQNWKFKNEHDLWSGFKLGQMASWLKDAGFKVIHLEENKTYSFKFYDIEDENSRIEVPLLYAHCMKES